MSYEMLANLNGFDKLLAKYPQVASQALSMAINTTANRSGLSLIKKKIYSQVAFPQGYLDLAGRLKVTRQATPFLLEAAITGRDRATSLARFQPFRSPAAARGKRIPIQVKTNGPSRSATAFLVQLKNGNLGLAIYGPNVPSRAHKPQLLKRGKNGKSSYIVYGPSVEQVFKGVASEVTPDLQTAVTKEFDRQFLRLSSAVNL
jgi:hypothetical protein